MLFEQTTPVRSWVRFSRIFDTVGTNHACKPLKKLTNKLLSPSQHVGRDLIVSKDEASFKVPGCNNVNTSPTVVDVLSTTVRNSFKSSITDLGSETLQSMIAVTNSICFNKHISSDRSINAFDHSFW